MGPFAARMTTGGSRCQRGGGVSSSTTIPRPTKWFGGATLPQRVDVDWSRSIKRLGFDGPRRRRGTRGREKDAADPDCQYDDDPERPLGINVGWGPPGPQPVGSHPPSVFMGVWGFSGVHRRRVEPFEGQHGVSHGTNIRLSVGNNRADANFIIDGIFNTLPHGLQFGDGSPCAPLLC